MRIFYILAVIIFTSCSNIDNTIQDAEKKFYESYPDLKIDTIEKINDSFFEILIGDQIFYISSDLKYLIAGNVIELATKKNLTQDKIKDHRISFINNIDPKNTIIYKPDNTKHVLNIFTDISCPYCKKLHNEIDSLIENDIEVRYILFSRNGGEDDAHKEMISIWCSDDKKLSLDKAFDGEEIPEKNCENPLGSNLQLAYDLRVNGTPMIFKENGDIIPGYVPYRQILESFN